MHHSWTCRCCGGQFDELPLNFASAAPGPWLELTEEERSARGKIDSDICVIDRQQFFVRGCLEVPIIDYSTAFVWGIWISVAKPSFRRVLDLWNAEVRESEPPLFGWLCNTIYGYPDTYGLKTNVHLRNNRERPFVELEPTDHPLAIEQRTGISLSRAEEIVATLLPHPLS
jgi:hypothetical protein